MLLGAGAYVFAHHQKAPPLIYTAAGIIPLLPNLTIYRGMLFVADGNTGAGLLLLSERPRSASRSPRASSWASSSPNRRNVNCGAPSDAWSVLA